MGWQRGRLLPDKIARNHWPALTIYDPCVTRIRHSFAHPPAVFSIFRSAKGDVISVHVPAGALHLIDLKLED